MTYQEASCSKKHQRQLILADGKNSAQDERNAIGMLLVLGCEAIIVYPKFLSVEALETLIEQHETPIIVINRKLPHYQNHEFYIEHYHSSHLMTQYLLDQGHTRIAFIAELPGSPSGEERIVGFLDTLKTSSIAHDEALSLERGLDAGERLSRRPNAARAQCGRHLCAGSQGRYGHWRGEGVS